jgi:hypothetical protein
MKTIILNRIILTLLFVTPIFVIGSFIKINTNANDKEFFEDSIEGSAYKPFAGRVLVPILVRNLSHLVPASVSRQLDDWAKEKIERLFPHTPEIKFTHLLISVFIWYSSIIGFSFSLLAIIRLFYETSDITALLVTLTSVAGIPVFFRYYSYLYDLPQLFLFTFCLYYLARSNWYRYILFFAIATLNKETSVLLIFIYSLHFARFHSRSIYLRLLTIQVAFYLVIRLIINASTINNPGSIVEFHLFHNLLLEPYSVAQFLAFLCIGLLIGYDWKNKPTFIKDALAIAVPMVLLTLLFGYLDEYRDFYELYPIIILLIAHTIIKQFMHATFIPRTVRA